MSASQLRDAAIGFLPVALLNAFLCMRTETVGGTVFMTIDALTMAGILLSLILSLLALCWLQECGDGWMDRLLAIVACLPFLVLLYRLDPTGSGPLIL